MNKLSLSTIERALTKAAPEQQRRFLASLPRLLNLSAEDFGLTRLSEQAFDFWNNPEDQIYDHL